MQDRSEADAVLKGSIEHDEWQCFPVIEPGPEHELFVGVFVRVILFSLKWTDSFLCLAFCVNMLAMSETVG